MQGRVRIGDHLLRAIDVQSQVVLVGALSRIEVWKVRSASIWHCRRALRWQMNYFLVGIRWRWI